MSVIEDRIIEKAREFDSVGDWPQPFDAFIPMGETSAHTEQAIRALQHDGRLAVLAFEAEGMGHVDVVAGFGPKIPHSNKPGPGEYPYPGRRHPNGI